MKDETLTPIQKYYEGKTIFLTGGTGFVGKVLLEKILRCCFGIAHIYLMVREKRGKNIEKRVEELFNADLFDLVKKEHPSFRKKVSVIYGDLERPDLGICKSDLEILQANVDIIIHNAARVRWDDALRVQAKSHLVASNSLLDMVKEFKKAKVFIYVSTAAVHRDPDYTVPEQVVKKHISPKQLLDVLEWMDDQTISKIPSAFTKNDKNMYTNMYMLTKALTENIVEENHGHLLTAIVRPTIVFPTIKDPYPGWCDTIQSLHGLVLAVAKGFMRTAFVAPNTKLCIVPADLVANTIISTSWYMENLNLNNKNDVFIVNTAVEGEKLPILNKEFLDLVHNKIIKYPLANIFRYPSLTVYYSSVWYNIHAFFDQYIPAIIVDSLLKIFTGKPIMLRLYDKLHVMFDTLQQFSSKPWVCKMDNYYRIRNQMNKRDAEVFFMEIKELNWDTYTEDMVIAGRKLLAKEDMSNLEYARRKSKIWLFTTFVLKWMLIFYILKHILLQFT